MKNKFIKNKESPAYLPQCAELIKKTKKGLRYIRDSHNFKSVHIISAAELRQYYDVPEVKPRFKFIREAKKLLQSQNVPPHSIIISL
jgi:hypothetical protein